MKKATLFVFLALLFAIFVTPVSFAQTDVPTETGTSIAETSEEKKPEFKLTELDAKNCTCNSITLTWNAHQDANCYVIHKYDTKSKKYKQLDVINGTSYTIKKLKANTEYKFSVTPAFISQEIVKNGKKTTVSAKTAPKKVGTIISGDIDKKSITLCWSTVSGADGYQVYILNKDSGKFEKIKTTQTTEYKVTGLEECRLYSFKIRAYSVFGEQNNYAPYSDEFCEFTDYSYGVKTNAQAAKKYNTVVNTAKAKKDVKVVHNKKVSTEAEYASKHGLFLTIKNLLQMWNGETKTTYTFKDRNANGKTLNSLIQPIGNNAKLRACDIKSFTTSKNKDGNSELSITLKSETTEFDGSEKSIAKSKSIGRAVSQINITKKKTAPIQILNGTQKYNDVNVKLTYKDKSIISLSTKLPVTVKSTFKVSNLKYETRFKYTVSESFKFSN